MVTLEQQRDPGPVGEPGGGLKDRWTPTRASTARSGPGAGGARRGRARGGASDSPFPNNFSGKVPPPTYESAGIGSPEGDWRHGTRPGPRRRRGRKQEVGVKTARG